MVRTPILSISHSHTVLTLSRSHSTPVNMAPTSQLYSLAKSEWPLSLPIQVHDQSGQRLCVVPKDFLVGSGSEPLPLLTQLVGMCVSEPGFLVSKHSRERLSNVDQLDGKTLIWMRQGESQCASVASRDIQASTHALCSSQTSQICHAPSSRVLASNTQLVHPREDPKAR